MKLEIRAIWDPDLNPSSEGLPPDSSNFDVFIQMRTGEIGGREDEVYGPGQL
jgi:hypothetical protein